MLCWLVINKNLKLSSALFLHSKSMFKEGIEILGIVVLMALLTRCMFLSHHFYL